jgi:hypothetical protein
MNTIPIQSPLDVTSARNLLRKKITGTNWLPPFRARAATTLTLMGEIILQSGQSGTLVITVQHKQEIWGIELECTCRDGGQLIGGIKYQQLQHLVDSLDVVAKDGHLNLKTAIWLS